MEGRKLLCAFTAHLTLLSTHCSLSSQRLTDAHATACGWHSLPVQGCGRPCVFRSNIRATKELCSSQVGLRRNPSRTSRGSLSKVLTVKSLQGMNCCAAPWILRGRVHVCSRYHALATSVFGCISTCRGQSVLAPQLGSSLRGLKLCPCVRCSHAHAHHTTALVDKPISIQSNVPHHDHVSEPAMHCPRHHRLV